MSNTSSVSIPSATSEAENCQNFNGITFESNTGPTCQIEEIDDVSLATIGLLKDAVCQCLDLANWVQRNHIQLFYKGTALLDDNSVLGDYDIKGGSTLNYVIMIA